MTNNDCFPRGSVKGIQNKTKPLIKNDGIACKANNKTKKLKPPQEIQDNLFGVNPEDKKPKIKKKFKKQNVEKKVKYDDFDESMDEAVENEDAQEVSADILSYNKIHEGMTLLACVRDVDTMFISLELPGRCYGEIPIHNISDSFSKVITAAAHNPDEDIPNLKDYLPVGTFLPVKVVTLQETKDVTKVICSSNPAQVNSHLKHNYFASDMLVWGAIRDVSDHGYTVDLGVKHLRAHLPFASVDTDVQYKLGQVLYMVVKKCASSKEATTLTLSARQADFNETVESAGTSINHVIPGMQVDFQVKDLLKDGLQGEYFDECTGFVNDLYLKKQFDTGKNYKQLHTHKARLLYVHPMSKHGYFTLRPLNQRVPQWRAQVGCKFSSVVTHRTKFGLITKLQNGNKGLITYKRLSKMLTTPVVRGRGDLQAVALEQFPYGTKKECTILDYNHMEQLYICTFEEISEIINIAHFQLGQIVKGNVKGINDYGVVIRVGKFNAFAPNDHLSNLHYSENIKRKFETGQSVTAKILEVDVVKKNIKVTLKPALIENNTHLTSLDNIDYTRQYPGVIMDILTAGPLVVFYGGVKGLLPRSNLPHLEGGLRGEYYIGKVVKVYVEKVMLDKMILAMTYKKRKRPVNVAKESFEAEDADSNESSSEEEQQPVKKKQKKLEAVSKESPGKVEKNLVKKKAQKQTVNGEELQANTDEVKKNKKKKKQSVVDESSEEVQGPAAKKQKKVQKPAEEESPANVEKLSKKQKKQQKEILKAEKQEDTNEVKKKKKKKNQLLENESMSMESESAGLSGMVSFFDTNDDQNTQSDSEDDCADITKPKKKLTSAERLQKFKDEEARLRKIETELADPSMLPQSAEHFDRALLGNPNDSQMWIHYMAFYVQSTEFEKAREVAWRAIERISYTALQDRLNVWIAFLNLENLYGTKESFEKVFQEAVRRNDGMTIYLQAIRMLSEMDKMAEMDQKIKSACGMFKQEVDMWLEVGKVYYQCGRLADARKLKDRALLNLTNKKTSFRLIVQFAIMEFNFGETTQGEALFETILQTDPKRVDVWTTYVDQLVKKGKIDLARSVLSRAVGQKLPTNKMRTLFTKFQTFETAHGDDETLAKVNQLLQEYSSQT